jgi:hypothetical protein
LPAHLGRLSGVRFQGPASSEVSCPCFVSQSDFCVSEENDLFIKRLKRLAKSYALGSSESPSSRNSCLLKSSANEIQLEHARNENLLASVLE